VARSRCSLALWNERQVDETASRPFPCDPRLDCTARTSECGIIARCLSLI
jgi:hypothetical protein